jgi:protein gp37
LIFVCSQTDLFGEFVPDEMIDRMFAVMALSPWHRFQVLTKRAERMQGYFADLSYRQEAIGNEAQRISGIEGLLDRKVASRIPPLRLPLPHVIVGVSVEDRKRLHRIEALFNTPAAVRFASMEPMLDDVGAIRDTLMRQCSECKEKFERSRKKCSTASCDGQTRGGLDWVIVGGESGSGARPCNLTWVRSIRDLCVDLNVPFFFKQWGEWMPAEYLPTSAKGTTRHKARNGMVRVGRKEAGRLLDGRTWNEMPEISAPL